MAGLTAEQRREYDEQGYVVFRQLLAPGETQPLVDEIEAAVDRLGRQYFAEGRIRSLYEGHDFKTRFMKMFEDCEPIYENLVSSRLMVPALFDVLRQPKILDVVESIVGSEIHCEGRHRLRPKMPNYGVADFRWHEDTLYAARRILFVEQQAGLGATDPRRSGKMISRIVPAPQMPEPGFWIPLVDVDETNGCLHVLPGAHRHNPPDESQWEPQFFVPQIEGLTPLAVPMQVGDVLMMHQHLPHVSPPNRSDHIRWSLDTRYQDAHQPNKSLREPGFLARSKEHPDQVIATYEGYVRIREAVQTFLSTPGVRL